MELLLNLFWLLLLVPVCCLWRGRKPHAKPWLIAGALGCLLFILFPVISATDDLCTWSQAIEESVSGSWSQRRAYDSHSTDTFPAQAEPPVLTEPTRQNYGHVPQLSVADPAVAHGSSFLCRPPPSPSC